MTVLVYGSLEVLTTKTHTHCIFFLLSGALFPEGSCRFRGAASVNGVSSSFAPNDFQ